MVRKEQGDDHGILRKHHPPRHKSPRYRRCSNMLTPGTPPSDRDRPTAARRAGRSPFAAALRRAGTDVAGIQVLYGHTLPMRRRSWPSIWRRSNGCDAPTRPARRNPLARVVSLARSVGREGLDICSPTPDLPVALCKKRPHEPEPIPSTESAPADSRATRRYAIRQGPALPSRRRSSGGAQYP